MGSRVDGGPALLSKAQIVAVIPNFYDLAVFKAVDVDRRESRPSPGWLGAAPATAVRPGSRPATDHGLEQLLQRRLVGSSANPAESK